MRMTARELELEETAKVASAYVRQQKQYDRFSNFLDGVASKAQRETTLEGRLDVLQSEAEKFLDNLTR